MNPRAPSGSLGAGGFTLVELLIGVTLLLIVVAGVHTSFSTGVLVRQSSRARLESLQSVRQLVSILGDDLRNLRSAPSLAIEPGGLSLLRHPRTSYLPTQRTPWALAVRYRWGDAENPAPPTRVQTPLFLEGNERVDVLAALGYEEREGSLVPAWLQEAPPDETTAEEDSSETPWASFGTVRKLQVESWVRQGGELVEGVRGVLQTPSAVRVQLSTGATESAASLQEFTIWLPSGSGLPARGASE